MYCYEKPRTEDKTRVHKSFSPSTTQSLPDVAQRRFVGWDSEELSGNPQPKIGNLSGYSVNSIRIHYSPSGPVGNGIRMNDNSRSEREADMEDKGSNLSGTARLSTKPETGQPCIQFKLPEDTIKAVVQEFKQRIKNSDFSLTEPDKLKNAIKKRIMNQKKYEWTDVVEIVRRLNAELPDEPPEPVSTSLEGFEVSFVGKVVPQFSKVYQEYKWLVVSQPFEGRFTATNNQIYYHTEGPPRGSEDAKPIWQVVGRANKKVTIKLLGLYRHPGNDTSSYEIYIPLCMDPAPPDNLSIRPKG